MRPVAFITGGTRGIGYAIACALQDDYHLIIGGSSDKAAAVAAEFPSAEAFIADLSDVPALDATGIERVDVLIHCAGVVAHDPVLETPLEDWQRAFAVNVLAPIELTRQLKPVMPRGATVVALNSGAGHHSGPGYGPYAATKFALRAFTDALREEHREELRVISIHPGKTDSDMQRTIQDSRGNAYDEAQFMKPESVAAAVRAALEIPRDAMVESLTIRPTNGL